MMRLWKIRDSVSGWNIRGWMLAAVLICISGFPAVANPSPSSDSGPTFTVKPPKGPWTLIAYGDMRFTDPTDRVDSNPTARQALVKKIADEKPNVLLISGDLPFHGGEANDYVVYHAETGPWRQAGGIRVFPALGNHELYDPLDRNGCGTCLENWWKTFPELRGRRWYSVRFGKVYIITLDSNLDLYAGSEQGQWLARQLKELPSDIRYLFISLHHPPMADPVLFLESHAARPNEEALAQQVEAAAKQIKAKIVVVAGHIHNYERFQRGGVDYLVSGGGGARPYRVNRSPGDLYRNNVFPNFHYVKFVGGGDMLRATMYRFDGNRFIPDDSFTVGELAPANAKNPGERFDLVMRIRWALACLQQLIDDSYQLLGIGRLLQI